VLGNALGMIGSEAVWRGLFLRLEFVRGWERVISSAILVERA